MDYSTEYYSKNFNMHEDSVEWKVELCLPFIDFLYSEFKDSKEINILDIGGSALILANISTYIEDNYSIKVNKYCIDLDSKVNKIQKKNNPDVIETSVEDIQKKTHFVNKQFDLILCNDVIEHVFKDHNALAELSRIGRFVYFKTPLENSILYRFLNLVTFGNFRKVFIRNLGHINYYNKRTLDILIGTNFFIRKYSYANSFEYFLRPNCPSIDVMTPLLKLVYKVYAFFGSLLYKVSPDLSATVMTDFYIVLGESKNYVK